MSWKRKTGIRVPNHVVHEVKRMLDFFHEPSSNFKSLSLSTYTKIRMAVHVGDQGLDLPSILSPATSKCRRRVGTGEEN